jgi:hypothetical protein
MSQFDPFEDLGLKYLALSSFGFPTTLIKVTNRAKTPGGFTVGSAFKVRTSGIKVGEIRGTLTPSYEVKDLNMVAKLTLDTDNAGKIGLEFSDPLGVENSKLNVSLTQSVEKQEAETVAQGAWSYTRGKYGLKFGGATTMERLTGHNASATAFIQNPENVYWSATGNLLPDKENKMGLSKVDGKVCHITPDTEALFNVIWNRTNEVTYATSWYQRLSPKTNYGVEFTTSVGEQDILTTAVVVGEYEIDSQTTIRAKSTNTNAGPRLGFGLSQKNSTGVHSYLRSGFECKTSL